LERFQTELLDRDPCLRAPILVASYSPVLAVQEIETLDYVS